MIVIIHWTYPRIVHEVFGRTLAGDGIMPLSKFFPPMSSKLPPSIPITGDAVSALDPVVDVAVVVAAAKAVLLALLLPCLEPQYRPLKLRLAEHDIGGVSGMGPLVLTPSDAKCFLHQSICFVFLLLFVVVEDEDPSAAEDNDE